MLLEIIVSASGKRVILDGRKNHNVFMSCWHSKRRHLIYSNSTFCLLKVSFIFTLAGFEDLIRQLYTHTHTARLVVLSLCYRYCCCFECENICNHCYSLRCKRRIRIISEFQFTSINRRIPLRRVGARRNASPEIEGQRLKRKVTGMEKKNEH